MCFTSRVLLTYDFNEIMCIDVYIYIYIYIYIYVCVCVCVCICMYIHTYIQKHVFRSIFCNSNCGLIMTVNSLGNIVNGLLNCFVSVRKYVASLKFKLVSTPKLG